jgi:hypothetical protein
VESLSDLIEAYAEARERETWEVLLGRRAQFDAEGLEVRFEPLTSGDALEVARADRDAATSPDLRLARERLCFAVEDAVLEARTRALAALVQRREAAGAAQDELAERREEHFARLADVRAKLGYATGRARAEARHPGVDFDGWGREAARFLESTNALYRDALPALARRAKVAPSVRTRADLERLVSMASYDALFSAGRREPCLEYTLDGMGAALGKLRGVAVDAPPGVVGRPACVAIRRPGNVRVVVRTPVGAPVYRGYFHAAGRALHAVFTSSSLPVERRRLGDPALFAAFGELVRQLLADPVWLADFPAGRSADELARAARFERLARLRRAAGRVAPALALAALAGGSPHRLSDLYASALGAATAVEHAPPEFLAGTDSELGPVHALRALCLASQLAELLRRRCGRRFWRERSTGALLKEIWNTGTAYTAEGLASELGLGPLGVDSLIDDVRPRD